MSTALVKLTDNLAKSFSLDTGNSKDLIDTLKATAFKVKDGVVSDAQMTALLIVAQQYGLNPWVKEIFAFPDKQNGIVPIVGVDGWTKICDNHPQYDGVEFVYADEITKPPGGKSCPIYIDCIIHRKDRTRPTVAREYLDEVYRESQYKSPWQTHTKRFLRHKAFIQCARLAFGFSGIYDQDEAEGFVDTSEKVINQMPSFQETSKLNQKVAEIATMTREQLTKDGLMAVRFYDGWNEQELVVIKNAVNARRNEIRSQSAPVADIKPTIVETKKEPEPIGWERLILTAKDDDALVGIVASIPDDELGIVIENLPNIDLINQVYNSLSAKRREKFDDIFDFVLSVFK